MCRCEIEKQKEVPVRCTGTFQALASIITTVKRQSIYKQTTRRNIQKRSDISGSHAANMKFRVIWDVEPCSLGEDRRFRGAYCPDHQGDKLGSP
jgi:hypothetical protein